MLFVPLCYLLQVIKAINVWKQGMLARESDWDDVVDKLAPFEKELQGKSYFTG